MIKFIKYLGLPNRYAGKFFRARYNLEYAPLDTACNETVALLVDLVADLKETATELPGYETQVRRLLSKIVSAAGNEVTPGSGWWMGSDITD